MSGVHYYQGAERPSLSLWLLDDDGTLIDFSSGYTFSFRIGQVGVAAVLNKTSGITGAVGAGSEPTGTPNVTVAWLSGELDITPGSYEWQLVATSGGFDRVFGGIIRILGVISA